MELWRLLASTRFLESSNNCKVKKTYPAILYFGSKFKENLMRRVVCTATVQIVWETLGLSNLFAFYPLEPASAAVALGMVFSRY